MRFPHARLVSPLLAALAVSATTASAHAEDGIILRYVDPFTDSGTSTLGTLHSRTLPHLGFAAGLGFQYIDAPLRFEPVDVDGIDAGDLVASQVWVQVGAALGVLGWLDVDLQIPMAASSGSSALTLLGRPRDAGLGFALGDVQLTPRVQIIDGRRSGGLGLAFALPLYLPSGSAKDFTGDGGLRLEPRLILDLAFADGWRVSVNAGYHVRPETTLYNVVVDDELRWSVALVAPVGVRGLSILGSAIGNVSFANAKDPRDLSKEASDSAGQHAVELLLGARYELPFGLGIVAAGGASVLDGVGGSRFRVMLSVDYHPVDGDSDHDGLVNSVDPCPLDPEDKDDFEDDDGCPDPDNDRDDILDVADKCVNEPEDRDGWQDDDGCPDPDDDLDGVLDADDSCPRVVGNVAKGGCPLETIVITLEKLELPGKIFFALGSDNLDPVSFPLLDDVARILNENTRLKRIEIQGHTDTAGGAAYNDGLSERRGRSVLEYLVQKGVDRSRLTSKGYGYRKPLVPPSRGGETKEEAAQNRRVEFVILEQDLQKEIIR